MSALVGYTADTSEPRARDVPLPDKFSELITLALEDLTPGEIAAVLGVTENNVAVRLNRARKALRSILEDRP